MTDRATDALVALRQIQRKVELATRKLSRDTNLTPSQLRVLELLAERGSRTSSELAKETQLSNATITALTDKLVARELVTRVRSDIDRRKVSLGLTEAGRQALQDAPTSLQNLFEARFASLDAWEQAMLVASLERVANMLDAENLEVAPILTTGDIASKAV